MLRTEYLSIFVFGHLLALAKKLGRSCPDGILSFWPMRSFVASRLGLDLGCRMVLVSQNHPKVCELSMCVPLSIWFLGGPCSGMTKFDDCDAIIQMRDAIAAYDSMAKDEEVCIPTTHYRISHHHTCKGNSSSA